MDFEPWWLISIPVLFALGWIAARVDIRQMLSETRALPKSYFRGRNFLLNEEPDRAIDAFIEVAKLDPETTELHFALGGLFRRRGEIERAIRVHHSLLARADLPAPDREMALHELAQDYLKAGMLDRAESAFKEVLDTRYAVPAVRALIRIHESSHEWERAVEAVARLQALVNEPVPQLVHYQCELAAMALNCKPADLDAAAQALDAADKALLSLGDQSAGHAAAARIAMVRAQVAALNGDLETQCSELSSVLRIAPDYGGLVAADLMACHHEMGRAGDGLTLLRNHYEKSPALDTFAVLFHELHVQEGAESAWAFAAQALRMQPSLLGLDRVLELELSLARERSADAADPATKGAASGPEVGSRSESGAASGPRPGAAPGSEPKAAHEQAVQWRSGIDFGLLKAIIHRHTQRLDKYACRVCGFEARHYYWQCPGCNAWETYEPRRLEEMK